MIIDEIHFRFSNWEAFSFLECPMDVMFTSFNVFCVLDLKKCSFTSNLDAAPCRCISSRPSANSITRSDKLYVVGQHFIGRHAIDEEVQVKGGFDSREGHLGEAVTDLLDPQTGKLRHIT